jgi:hypothetical protein
MLRIRRMLDLDQFGVESHIKGQVRLPRTDKSIRPLSCSLSRVATSAPEVASLPPGRMAVLISELDGAKQRVLLWYGS